MGQTRSKEDDSGVPAPPTNVQIHPKDSEIILVRGHEENKWAGNLIHAPRDKVADKDQHASPPGAAKSNSAVVTKPNNSTPDGCASASCELPQLPGLTNKVSETFTPTKPGSPLRSPPASPAKGLPAPKPESLQDVSAPQDGRPSIRWETVKLKDIQSNVSKTVSSQPAKPAMTGSWNAIAHSNSEKRKFDNDADAAPKYQQSRTVADNDGNTMSYDVVDRRDGKYDVVDRRLGSLEATDDLSVVQECFVGAFLLLLMFMVYLFTRRVTSPKAFGPIGTRIVRKKAPTFMMRKLL